MAKATQVEKRSFNYFRILKQCYNGQRDFTRGEFWPFFLINVVVLSAVLAFIVPHINPVVGMIIFFAMLIYMLPTNVLAMVGRLRNAERSVWNILWGITPLAPALLLILMRKTADGHEYAFSLASTKPEPEPESDPAPEPTESSADSDDDDDYDDEL